MTTAAMAKPVSRPLTVEATAGRGARTGFGAAGAAALGAAAAAETAGAATGEATGTAAGAEAAGGGAALTAAGTGILIVGAAVGLGGRLIRTVSFLGWTFAASAGFGGTAPVGMFGIFSAIRSNQGSN